MNEFSYMCSEDIVRTVSGGCKVDLDEYPLTKLANMTEEELTKIKGVGPKTAKKILAAFELGRRLLQSKQGEKPDLGSSIAVYNHLYPILSQLDHEEFHLIIMNQHFKLIKSVKVAVGGITDVCVDIRVIMRHVVSNDGTVIAVAHNHPSGSPSPSKNDDLITKMIAKACEIMRVFFMDHVIIGDGCFYSYHDRGKL